MINQPPPRETANDAILVDVCFGRRADGQSLSFSLCITIMMMAIIIRFNDKQNMSPGNLFFWMKKATKDKYEMPLEIKKN